jgi:hypothetical protein
MLGGAVRFTTGSFGMLSELVRCTRSATFEPVSRVASLPGADWLSFGEVVPGSSAAEGNSGGGYFDEASASPASSLRRGAAPESGLNAPERTVSVDESRVEMAAQAASDPISKHAAASTARPRLERRTRSD